MRVVPYNPDKHSGYMATMLDSRGLDKALVNDLPKFGLIALDKGLPIAAGFVRHLEGGFGVMDSFVTNYKVKALKRDRALQVITLKIISIAKQNKVRGLMAFTSDYNTAARASRVGFLAESHKFFILNTKD